MPDWNQFDHSEICLIVASSMRYSLALPGSTEPYVPGVEHRVSGNMLNVSKATGYAFLVWKALWHETKPWLKKNNKINNNKTGHNRGESHSADLEVPA